MYQTPQLVLVGVAQNLVFDLLESEAEEVNTPEPRATPAAAPEATVTPATGSYFVNQKLPEHIRANVTDDGLVILDIDKCEIFSTNVVAARIWNLLMEGKSLQEAMDAVVAEFDAPREMVERDTVAFVDSLRTKGIVAN